MSIEKNPGDRRLLLCGNVEEGSISSIIGDIRKINHEDDQREKKFCEFNREENPIELMISSYGGSVYCGLGLYDVIESSKTPVHTIVNGKAMSMGFILLLAGHKRLACKNATLMYHELAYGCFDKLEGHKIELEEANRLQDELLDKIVLEKTSITKERLLEIRERKKEWYLTATEAKKFGVVDEIV